MKKSIVFVSLFLSVMAAATIAFLGLCEDDREGIEGKDSSFGPYAKVTKEIPYGGKGEVEVEGGKKYPAYSSNGKILEGERVKIVPAWVGKSLLVTKIKIN